MKDKSESERGRKIRCTYMFEWVKRREKGGESLSFFSLFTTLHSYLCNPYHTRVMPGSVKSTIKGEVTKTKEQPPKKKKKTIKKRIHFSSPSIPSSSSSTTHQQHHSAPPSHSQQSKIGLGAIHENGEYLSTNEQQLQQQQQQQQQQLLRNNRFPRSSTVPYPAYATMRTTAGNYIPPPYYYYTDDPTYVHETISPAQLNTRQPLSLMNTNFQPISPHHHQYSTRPVDILKPTFLIVPKADEQRLIAHLSASNSPVLTTYNKTKSITKIKDTKSSQKSTATIQQSPSTVRSVEVQTNNELPTKTTMDVGHRHIGLLGTPNPAPYVHFVNVSYPTQSPQLSQEGPPETTIIQDEFSNLHDYNQPSASIQSMPNIALTQGKNCQ
jgi:hypothetical protein